MLPNNSFITTNVNRKQSYKKRLNVIQYFNDEIGSAGLSFLQETHSDSKVEQKWREKFKRQDFFSCGVLTAYFGTDTS